MTGPALAVSDLTKSYGPKGLTFSVPRGAICGFLGPNGAGKTTTLRILMGLAHEDGGTAEVLGTAAGTTHEIFRRVAFVPEVKDLYPFARASEMIRLTRGFYPDWDAELERRLTGEFAIPLRTFCPRLSKGQRSALALLLALCRRTELLVLDEPTEGLDPIAREHVLRLLVAQAGDRGATVFFSTHNLDEVEQIADHVVMINAGRATAAGELDAVRQRFRRVRVALDDTNGAVPAALATWRRDGRLFSGFSPDDAPTLAARLAGSGVTVLESEPATLKEIWTRFACATAAAVALFGAMLAINAAVLRVAGWPVPLADMARVSALALGVVIAAMALLGSLVPVWSEAAAQLGVTIALVPTVFGGWGTLVGIVTGDVHAPLLSGAAATVVVSLGVAGAIAARKDF